jgi:hypothetical protein
MNRTSIAATLIAAMTFASGAHAASITGAINFSSAPGGGVRLQDSGGILTTNILQAAGIQQWLLPQVDVRSGSFVTVTQGASVSMPSTWVFNPSTPLSPLWSIPGPDNFAFHLSSAIIELQTTFLLISGTGTLTGTGFDPTPATWFFSTQGVATDGKYSWSSSTTAVPEVGTPALIGAALLGACFLRSRNLASSSPKNNQHETHISPRDVSDCPACPDIGESSGLHFRLS